MADKEDLENMCFCETNPNCPIVNSGVSTCGEAGYVFEMENLIRIRFSGKSNSRVFGSLGSQERLWRLLAGAEAGEDDREGAGEDFEVEPEGPVVDVLEVEFHPLVEA